MRLGSTAAILPNLIPCTQQRSAKETKTKGEKKKKKTKPSAANGSQLVTYNGYPTGPDCSPILIRAVWQVGYRYNGY
jgi:hypothetical protein